MVKLKDYAYSKHFINHKLWFSVTFISERQWNKFWNDAYDGKFIYQLGTRDGVFHYVPGTCPELDNVFLMSTGFPRSIKFKAEFGGLLARN